MQYSERFKEKMVQRMAGPNGMTATELSQQVGVSQSTLSRWLRQANVAGMAKKDEGGRRRRGKKRSPEEKLRLVLASEGLSEAELGAFLRREGLFEEELEEIRREVREAALSGLKPPAHRRGATPEQKRIEKLEKELKRKDRALAETAALLVLQGKVKAFLASQEDEEGEPDDDSER